MIRSCIICAQTFNGQGITCSPRCKRTRKNHMQNAQRSFDRECTVCTATFSSTSPKAIYCSTTCEGLAKSVRYTGQRPSRRRQAAIKLAMAIRGTTAERTWIAGVCRRCGSLFVATSQGQGAARYCTAQCKGRDAKTRRRALLAGAKVTPGRRHAVFERDQWRCRICGDPVNRDAVVPALDSPVIDHIVPLAAGGDHCESNWQTAHFYCNSVKQDRVGFDFAA